MWCDSGRVYESREEEELRRGIFEENVDFIRAHNEKYLAEDTTYFMGINQFADMVSHSIPYTKIKSNAI